MEQEAIHSQDQTRLMDVSLKKNLKDMKKLMRQQEQAKKKKNTRSNTAHLKGANINNLEFTDNTIEIGERDLKSGHMRQTSDDKVYSDTYTK